jgi:hypothetical protein
MGSIIKSARKTLSRNRAVRYICKQKKIDNIPSISLSVHKSYIKKCDNYERIFLINK